MPILGSLIVALLGWLVIEQRSLRWDVQDDIADLRERMARLEGRMDALQGAIVQLFSGREATSLSRLRSGPSRERCSFGTMAASCRMPS